MTGQIASTPAETSPVSRAAQAIAECRLLAAMSEEPTRTTRRYLTPPVAQVHARLGGLMRELGMDISTDATGNLRGLWQPEQPRGQRLILGSHIDTVPDAGAFDGVLGVVLSLELVRLAQQLRLGTPIEVIAFSEEEGVRYGVPFLGSRAVAGTFERSLLALKDADGIPMDAAIRAFGLDPARIEEAALLPGALGFLEIHIEQGPVLEAEDLQLAVVVGINGQTRLTLRFAGQANHAGTTPMQLRRDALAAAAEWMIAVEAAARATHGLVATAGKLSVEPNAGNVIPGQVEVSLDVRHFEDPVREAKVEEFLHLASQIAARRRLALDWTKQMHEPAVPMDPWLTSELASSLVSAGFPLKTMPSGAGHDAMVMAARLPTAMLFLRSPGGISHHPAETVREEDVEAALLVGEAFLRRFA